MYDEILSGLEKEIKENAYSGKGNKAKELIDKLDALKLYRMQEIDKHKEFLDIMAKVRQDIIDTEKEIKMLLKY